MTARRERALLVAGWAAFGATLAVATDSTIAGVIIVASLAALLARWRTRSSVTRPTPQPEPTVWPVLHYDDTAGALQFLTAAFGFRATVAVRDDDGDVVHAELRWPSGGAVVFGSTKHTDGVHGGMRPGVSAMYVVSDDVDAISERAVAAGAQIVQQPADTTFGSGARTRTFTARDPEGNLWTFGTYRADRPKRTP
jgi:uncharacterized glyoxalase superfamily protein PhnB